MLDRWKKKKPTTVNHTQLFSFLPTISLHTGTSCRWAWRWTPWGCGGSGGWRSPGCELSAPRCGSGHVPGWLCWGWWRSVCCAHHYAGPSARGPYMQRTPAWLLAKATRIASNKALFLSLKHSLCFSSVKIFSLLFLCKVESQWTWPVLLDAVESHVEITGRNVGSMFSFFW